MDKIPKNSRDAVSYGYLRLLYNEVMRHDLPIYLTGGNAKQLKQIFPDAVIDPELVFKGMQTLVAAMDTDT